MKNHWKSIRNSSQKPYKNQPKSDKNRARSVREAKKYENPYRSWNGRLLIRLIWTVQERLLLLWPTFRPKRWILGTPNKSQSRSKIALLGLDWLRYPPPKCKKNMIFEALRKRVVFWMFFSCFLRWFLYVFLMFLFMFISLLFRDCFFEFVFYFSRLFSKMREP